MSPDDVSAVSGLRITNSLWFYPLHDACIYSLYPLYEGVPEQLLLAYPTEDLVEALLGSPLAVLIWRGDPVLHRLRLRSSAAQGLPPLAGGAAATPAGARPDVEDPGQRRARSVGAPG